MSPSCPETLSSDATPAAGDGPPPGAVEGRLESCSGGLATGWAWDRSRPDARVALVLLCDGRPAAAGRADVYSALLRGRGIGDGGHGFALALPDDLRDARPHEIAVVVGPCRLPLTASRSFHGSSPAGDPWYGTDFAADDAPAGDPVPGGLEPYAARQEPAPAVRYRGALESIDDGVAFGWAFDALAPDERVAVEIQLDGAPVAATVADLHRPSLLRDGIGDGRHGFRVALPDAVRDAGGERIAARVPDGSLLAAAASMRAAQADPPATGAGGTGDSGAGTLLSLRPASALHLHRRRSADGFSASPRAEAIVLHDALTVRRPPLHGLAIQPGVRDPLAERRARAQVADCYPAEPLVAARLPGGLLDTRHYVICPDQHGYLFDSVRYHAALERMGYRDVGGWTLEHEAAEITQRDERIVVLGAQTNRNFSHWLLESVTRALAFAPFDDGEVRYAVPRLNDWQRDWLALVGVGAERLLELRPTGLTRFDEVIAVSRGMSRVFEFVPAAVAALSDLAPRVAQRRRIYSSRALAPHRHVVDEPGLVALLQRHGFEVAQPETLPAAEQVALFASAEVVVGEHGSGLTDTVFSPPGTLVIELQPEGLQPGENAVVRTLTALRGQPLVQVVCPQAPGQDDRSHGYRDLEVHLRHLGALLTRVLPG